MATKDLEPKDVKGGKTIPQELSVTKVYDKASPVLMQ